MARRPSSAPGKPAQTQEHREEYLTTCSNMGPWLRWGKPRTPCSYLAWPIFQPCRYIDAGRELPTCFFFHPGPPGRAIRPSRPRSPP